MAYTYGTIFSSSTVVAEQADEGGVLKQSCVVRHLFAPRLTASVLITSEDNREHLEQFREMHGRLSLREVFGNTFFRGAKGDHKKSGSALSSEKNHES